MTTTRKPVGRVPRRVLTPELRRECEAFLEHGAENGGWDLSHRLGGKLWDDPHEFIARLLEEADGNDRRPLERGRRSLEIWRLPFLRGVDLLSDLEPLGLTGDPMFGSPAALQGERDRLATAAAEGRWVAPALGTPAEHAAAYAAAREAWQAIGAAFLATGETRTDGGIWALAEFGDPRRTPDA